MKLTLINSETLYFLRIPKAEEEKVSLVENQTSVRQKKK